MDISTCIAFRMKSSSDEEGGRSVGGQTVVSIDSTELVDKDSKEDRELVNKIRDFNKASQLLKEKANGGSAPESMKQGGFEKGKVTHNQPYILIVKFNIQITGVEIEEVWSSERGKDDEGGGLGGGHQALDQG